MTNKNILLSNDCEIDTQPQLIIENNDVQCSHGATVAQLSPAEIFYLRSRGIKKELAETMLLAGFAQDLFMRIPSLRMRSYLMEEAKK